MFHTYVSAPCSVSSTDVRGMCAVSHCLCPASETSGWTECIRAPAVSPAPHLCMTYCMIWQHACSHMHSGTQPVVVACTSCFAFTFCFAVNLQESRLWLVALLLVPGGLGRRWKMVASAQRATMECFLCLCMILSALLCPACTVHFSAPMTSRGLCRSLQESHVRWLLHACYHCLRLVTMHTLNLAFGLLLWDAFCAVCQRCLLGCCMFYFVFVVFNAFMAMAWPDGNVPWPTQQLCS